MKTRTRQAARRKEITSADDETGETESVLAVGQAARINVA